MHRFPLPLLFLVLLLGMAAGAPLLPKPWGGWALPVLAGLTLVVVARDLPIRLWVAGGAVLGLIGIYALNPAYQWSEGLGLLPVESHIRGLPGSAFVEGSWAAFGMALALFAVFALAFRLPEGQVRGVQLVALFGGVAMAWMVLGQRLAPRPFPVFERTGIFVNENHFACFANMVLPVVLALAFRARCAAIQKGRLSSPAGLIVLAAVLMGWAVVMSHSRAGVAVLALMVAASVALSLTLQRRYPFSGVPISHGLKTMPGLAISVAGLFAVLAFIREWPHLGAIRGEAAFRFGILKDALAAWQAQAAWGVGPGAFSTVFPYYQSAVFQDHAILHAHCEPIQFLVEFGWAGGLWVWLAAGLAFSARNAAHGQPVAVPAFAELERRAFALGLAACALHCLVDFPLRIPLIALLAATWAGCWAGHRRAPAPVRPANPGQAISSTEVLHAGTP